MRTGIGIWDQNLRTGKSTWTTELEALFGLEPGSVQCFADFRARVHPDDIKGIEAQREAALQRHETFKLEFRIIHSDGQLRWISASGGAFYDGATGEPTRILGNIADITERKRAEERQRALVAELDHRVKNALATVDSVVSHTQQGSSSVANFAESLHGRIRSMASTHELLSFGRWHGVSLKELVRRELTPYATSHNVEINCPEVVLTPEAGQAMALVLHELATNAAKYGALSTKHGACRFRWEQRMNGRLRSPLVLEWQEIGGPPVVAPSKPSYGTSTIRDLIPYEFGGAVDLVLALDGVLCRLKLPADWVGHNGASFR